MSKLKVFLCIFIPVLLIGGGVGAFFFFNSGKFLPPKERVMLAISQTLGENNLVAVLSGNEDKAGANSVMTLYEGVSTLSSLDEFFAEDACVRTELDITLEELSIPDNTEAAMLNGAGITMISESDLNNRNIYTSYDVRYGGYSLIGLELFLNDNMVSIASEDFFDGYLTADTESLITDYNASALAELTGETIPEEYADFFNTNFFDILEAQYESNEAYSLENNMELFAEFYDSVEVEATDNREEFSVGGDDVKCDEFLVTVPGDSIHDLVNNYFDVLIERSAENIYNLKSYYNFTYGEYYAMDTGEDFMDASKEDLEEWCRTFMLDEYAPILEQDFNDLEIIVYLDSDNRLISFMIEEYEFLFEDVELMLTAETVFSGEEFLFDETTTEITLEDHEDNNVYFLMETEGATKDAVRSDEITLTVGNSEDEEVVFIVATSYDSESGDLNTEFEIGGVDNLEFEISFNSNIQYSEEEPSFVFEVDDFTIFYEENSYSFTNSYSGSYELTVIDEVTEPEGEALYLLEMSEIELTALAMEIYSNFENSPLAELVSY